MTTNTTSARPMIEFMRNHFWFTGRPSSHLSGSLISSLRQPHAGLVPVDELGASRFQAKAESFQPVFPRAMLRLGKVPPFFVAEDCKLIRLGSDPQL
jgi:hypothetical protein